MLQSQTNIIVEQNNQDGITDGQDDSNKYS